MNRLVSAMKFCVGSILSFSDRMNRSVGSDAGRMMRMGLLMCRRVLWQALVPTHIVWLFSLVVRRCRLDRTRRVPVWRIRRWCNVVRDLTSRIGLLQLVRKRGLSRLVNSYCTIKVPFALRLCTLCT